MNLADDHWRNSSAMNLDDDQWCNGVAMKLVEKKNHQLVLIYIKMESAKAFT